MQCFCFPPLSPDEFVYLLVLLKGHAILLMSNLTAGFVSLLLLTLESLDNALPEIALLIGLAIMVKITISNPVCGLEWKQQPFLLSLKDCVPICLWNAIV